MAQIVSTLEVRGLHRTFPGRPPTRALRGTDLTVVEGTITAVLGPSGSGKTTLLRTLAGMERPDAGSIELRGRVLVGPGTFVPPERRAIGLVPQEGALFPHLDVADNVAFGLRGRPRGERRARVAELLELVDLAGFEHRRAHELSGGQQQRVALARALAPDPDVVLLDEPFSALDTNLRAQVRAEVAATLQATGTTAVLVTHDQTEAMTMSDQLAVMRDGRIVQVGSPADVYRNPVDTWVADFVGDAVLLRGQMVNGQTVDCALGRLALGPATDGSPNLAGFETVTVFCRPEQIRPVSSDRISSDRVPSATRAEVRAVRFQGPDALVDLAVGDATVTARWSLIDLPQPGETVAIEVAGDVLTFPPD